MTRRTEPAPKPPTTRDEIVARKQEMASLKEAGEYLHVNPKTIRRLIARGQIAGYRIGKSIRVKVADLEQLRVPVSES
jgi:excisionase family DNA binding protein